MDIEIEHIEFALRLLAAEPSATAQRAAKEQLETAAWLWFHQDHAQVAYSPISVHTLACAVQGVLAQVAREQRKRISSLALKMSADTPHGAILRRAQNFYKHGNFPGKKARKSVTNTPDVTQQILADNIRTFERLFGYTTPLFELFLLRYSWTFPASKVRLKDLEAELIKRAVIEEVRNHGPSRLYEEVLPVVVEISRKRSYPLR